MNGYERTNRLESRMQGNLPVRFGERLAETGLVIRHGAAIRLHRDNPKMASQVTIGLLLLIFVGGGGLATLGIGS